MKQKENDIDCHYQSGLSNWKMELTIQVLLHTVDNDFVQEIGLVEAVEMVVAEVLAVAHIVAVQPGTDCKAVGLADIDQL